MEPGQNPAAEGVLRFGTEANPRAFEFSTTAGLLVPRVEVQTVGQDYPSAIVADGGIYMGSGAAAATRSIRYFGTGIGIDASHLSWVQHNVYDIGLSVNRPRTLRVGASVVTGVFTTAQRNATGAGHASTGAGASVYDSTLNKPVWSDGTNWRDATGAIV